MKRRGIKGILPVHGDILYALMIHGELSMTQIAELVDRKKSTVTTLVDKLIHLGYIEKKRDLGDNRVYLISLTDKGRRQR